MGRKTAYLPIDHPSVAAVACPVCHAPKGTPCSRKSRYAKSAGKYCETHTARWRLYNDGVFANDEEENP